MTTTTATQPGPTLSRVARWERRTEIPLILLAAAFVVAWAWPILDPRLEPGLQAWMEAVSWAVWAVFAVDFALRLVIAEDRGQYALRHWYDILMVAVPALRPLRLLRVLAVARMSPRPTG